jgi:hypothetical protein
VIPYKGGVAAADVNSQTGRAHLLLVSRTPGKAGGALGVVTLEGTCVNILVPFVALTNYCLLRYH